MIKLISKNGQVVRAITLQLIRMKIGDRIPRVEDFAAKFSVARGTVQSALAYLQEMNAIKLKARGYLGTILMQIDKKKLWMLTEHTTILGTMPLPYSRRYEGLATALCDSFERAEIPFNLAYQRGSQSRVNGVLAGRYDFAVCSYLSAEKSMETEPTLAIAKILNKQSFVGGHALILREGLGTSIQKGFRIGVDPSSIDQRVMTEQVIEGFDVSIIESPYNRLIDMLNKNEIDGTVWNVDEVREKFPNNNYVDIKVNGESDNTRAVLLYDHTHDFLRFLIEEIISEEEIERVQRMVMQDEILPHY